MRTIALALLLSTPAAGRCAMCWRTAQALGVARGQVLNAGIIVMATPPLLILAGFAIFLRRLDRK
jgi:hypothetical protein